MKRLIFYSLAPLLSIITLSCKYEEGPAISLRGVEKRIIGRYNVIDFSINDIDAMVLYNDSCGCIISFYHKKYYNPITYLSCEKWMTTFGVYQISNNKKSILISYNDSPMSGIRPLGSLKSSVWEIKRLTDRDIWLETIYNSDKYFMKLEEIKKQKTHYNEIKNIIAIDIF